MTTGHLLDRVYVAPAWQEYGVLWRTAPLNLSQDKTYRIHVLVGTRVLGFADIDVVRTIRQLIAVDRDEFVPLLKDFILPIRFRIEEGALCDPGSTCTSESVNLADDVPDVVTLPTGDGVTIPPQAAGGQQVQVTITVQECADDIDVDLPTFGRCLTITADPPLTDALDPPAVISVCDVDFDVHTAELSAEQERLVTLHRQSGETIQALPHADDACPAPGSPAPRLGARAPGLRGLAQAVGSLMKRGFAVLVAPRALHASAAVLDVGGGGESDFFSDFQFALPAQMEPVEGTSGQTAAPGDLVANPPAVRVTDRNGHPVAGARVTFAISGGGGQIGSTTTTAPSLADGIARAPFWRLGDAPGANSVQASGRGIGDAETGPFMPDLPGDYPGADPLPPSVTTPVPVGTGSVHFTATALTPNAGGGDFLVIDDMNMLQNDFPGSGRITKNFYDGTPVDNLTFFVNVVDYFHPGPRGSQTGVLFHRGHASQCGGDGNCPSANLTQLYAGLTAAGYTVIEVNTPAAVIDPVAANVKVIFLLTPRTNFSAAEVAILKTFLSEGGRVVFIGENPSYYGPGLAIQNDLLQQMGAGLRASNLFAACDHGRQTATIPSSHIASLPVTNGVSVLSIICAARLILSPGDVLIADDIDGFPAAAFARVDLGAAPAPVVAGVQSASEPEPNVEQTDPDGTGRTGQAAAARGGAQ